MAAIAAERRPVVPIVCAALIDGAGRILLQRRPPGKPMAGLWEFPGGKLATNETPEAALCRELREELALRVEAAALEAFAFASHAYADFHILLLLYLCRRWDGEPRSREGQVFAWVEAARLGDYPMPEADRPLIARLQALTA
jgi:8-oxo-dGTP diphosphatase